MRESGATTSGEVQSWEVTALNWCHRQMETNDWLPQESKGEEGWGGDLSPAVTGGGTLQLINNRLIHSCIAFALPYAHTNEYDLL